MKIVIAMDSFKESISSVEAVTAVARGIRNAALYNKKDVIIDKIPIADGGEGTVESITSSTGGKIVSTEVLDPLGRKITSFFGILPDNTAIIEMATASGLNLLKAEERNPLYTTTYGTGQLIKRALELGCKKIIIGIGGSATNDGGMGMAQALGIKFLDTNDNELKFGGIHLANLARIDLTNLYYRAKEAEFIVASDVTNPLCGPTGATRIYGPQKGADEKMIITLNNNLVHLAKIIKQDLQKEVLHISGGGAAGGLGAGLIAFLDAKIHKGIDVIMELVDFKKRIYDADIIVTGEGSIDSQTIYGKVPCGIGEVAKKQDKIVICICGTLGKNHEALYDLGLTSFFSILNKPMNLQKALQEGPALLVKETENIFRLIFALDDLKKYRNK